MNANPVLSAMILMTSLGVAGSAAADAMLQAGCAVDSKQAELLLDATGKGNVEVVNGGTRYSCALQLSGIEGPPFSDNATGMLVLDLAKTDCAPAGAGRKVQRTVALHITDPKLVSREAMAVIERRSGVFQCQVGQLDIDALAKLQQQLAAAR